MAGPKASGNIRVNVLMPPQTKKLIEFSAAKQGVSFSQWMRTAAIEHLKVKTKRRT